MKYLSGRDRSGWGRPGRSRLRLEELFTGLGFQVYAEDIWRQFPFYARAHQDCCSWGANGTDGDGRKVSFSSWDTMTMCARRGIEITPDKEWPNAYEVSAKGKDRQ